MSETDFSPIQKVSETESVKKSELKVSETEGVRNWKGQKLKVSETESNIKSKNLKVSE